MKKNLLTIAFAAVGMLLSVTACKKDKPTPDISETPNNSDNQSSNDSSKDSPDTPSIPQVPEDIDVIAISTDSDSYTVKKGETKKIDVQVQPVNATNKNVSFTSSNSEIADVSGGGVITGNKAGSTTITITSISTPTVSKIVSVVVTEDSSQPEKSELDIAKENALAELNKPVEGIDNLEQSNKDTIIKAKQDAIAALDSATSVSDVNNIVNEYKNKVNAAIAKDKEDKASIKALNDKKDSAKATVNSVDASLYRSDEQSTLASLKQTALDAIEAAESIQQVDSALTAFNTAVSNLKTDAQYKQEEKAALDKAKADAKTEIAAYKNKSDYKQDEQSQLQTLIDNASDALDNATTEDAVNDIVTQFKADADKLTTAAQHDEEDARDFEGAKAKYITYIDNYGSGVDYDTDESASLTTLKNNYKGQITALTGNTDGEKTPSQLYDEFIVAANQIETKAVKELRVAKEGATTQIATYSSSLSEYFADDQNAIQQKITEITAAINNAKLPSDVQTALNDLTTFINGKTKKADAITAAKVVVNGYETSAITGFEAENLSTANQNKTDAISAIDSATSQADIDSAVNTYKGQIDDLKVKDVADKALKKYKNDKKQEADDYKPDGYTDIASDEVATGALTNVKSSIDLANSQADIDTLLTNYKTTIDNLINNKKLANAKTEAQNQLANYISQSEIDALESKYQAEVASAKDTLQRIIDSTEVSKDQVETAINNYKTEIDRIKAADATYKNLSSARADAKAALDGLVTDIDGYTEYSATTDGSAAIASAKETAEEAIDNAEDSAGIQAAKDNFVTAVTELINDYKALATLKSNAITEITDYNHDIIPADKAEERTALIQTYTAQINAATSSGDIATIIENYKKEINKYFTGKVTYDLMGKTGNYSDSEQTIPYGTMTLGYINVMKATSPKDYAQFSKHSTKRDGGCMYNKVALPGSIIKVVIDSTNQKGDFAVKFDSSIISSRQSANVNSSESDEGLTWTPTAGSDYTYFNLSCLSNDTGYVSSISVYYHDDGTAYREAKTAIDADVAEFNTYYGTNVTDSLASTYGTQLEAAKNQLIASIRASTTADESHAALIDAKHSLDDAIEFCNTKETAIGQLNTIEEGKTIPDDKTAEKTQKRSEAEAAIRNATNQDEIDAAILAYRQYINSITGTVETVTSVTSTLTFAKCTTDSTTELTTSNINSKCNWSHVDNLGGTPTVTASITACTKVFQGVNNSFKLSSSKASGSFTVTFTGYTVSKVVIDATKYSTDAAKITVNNGTGQDPATGLIFDNLTGETVTIASSKRAYITKVVFTLVPDQAGA